MESNVMLEAEDDFCFVVKSKHFPRQTHVFTRLQCKSLENTGGKGEIACNKQFLLFPKAFSTHLENFVPFLPNLELLFTNSSTFD